MDNLKLAAKAECLGTLVEEHLILEHGMLPMLVHPDDFRFPTAEDYRDMIPHRHLLGKTEADIGIPPMHVWRAWENTSSDTGFYLAAMSYRFRCTGDPGDLAICRRTLAALKYIYDLGVEQGEPGFLCKPYGGVYSNQTSGDQIQCVVMGLEAFRGLAGPEDMATIDLMYRGMADHNIATNYAPLHGYFAYPATSEFDRGDWSLALIFIPLLYRAWCATGDARYLNEIERWYEVCDTRKHWQVCEGEFWGMNNWRAVYLPTLMLEWDPRLHELWRSIIRTTWRNMRLGLRPDGTSYSHWRHNSATGVTTPVSTSQPMPPARTGRSAIFAWGCVRAAPWFPDEPILDDARLVLENLDMDTFRFVMAAELNDVMPPSWRMESELLDMDSLVGWLMTYWEGRWRRYW